MKNFPLKATAFAIAVAASMIFLSSCADSRDDTSGDSERDQQKTSYVSESITDNIEVELPKIPFDSTSTTEEASRKESTAPTDTTAATEVTTAPTENAADDGEVDLPKIPF